MRTIAFRSVRCRICGQDVGLRLETVGPLLRPHEVEQFSREALADDDRFRAHVMVELGKPVAPKLRPVCCCTRDNELATIEQGDAIYLSTISGVSLSRIRAKIVTVDDDQLTLF